MEAPSPEILVNPVASKSAAKYASQANKAKKLRKKRVRGEKPKLREVVAIGETPREINARNGRSRLLDLPAQASDETANCHERLPRKTRTLLSRMRRSRGVSQASTPIKKGAIPQNAKICTEVLGKERVDRVCLENAKERDSENNMGATGATESTEADSAKQVLSKKTEATSAFDGMKPGETHREFMRRLKQERHEISVRIERRSNYQRMKKRAYYEKKKQRAMKRKRRRGAHPDDSDEDHASSYRANEVDDAVQRRNFQAEMLQHHWQAGRQNERSRAKKNDNAMGVQQEVKFGERVERPPQFSVCPRRIGRANNLVIAKKA